MIGAIRPFEPHDALVEFREEDEAECAAAGGGSCRESILETHRLGGEVSCVLSPRTGRPFAFFGMVETCDTAGAVWMLATPDISSNARTIAALTPSVISGWHLRRPLLFNYVDARNTLHIRWLRRLGFTFIKLHPRYGAAQLPFYEFVRIPHV